jgi:hypothetical protein
MRTLITLVALTSVAVAAAQGGSVQMPPQIKIPPAPAPVGLLSRADVQAELKLTPEQKKRTDAAVAGGRPPQGSPDKAYAEVRKALSAEQIKRLEQIHRQIAGPYALTYAPYASEFKLSQKQQDQLLAAFSDLMGAAVASQMQNAPPGGRVNVQLTEAQRTEMRAKMLDRAKSILSAQQMNQWQASLGRPFKPRS